MARTGWIAALLVTLVGAGSAGAQTSPLFQAKLNSKDKPLRGYVDMHTHPMSHLGFGGRLLHGAPGVGVLMPQGAIVGKPCNHIGRSTSISDALGSCYHTHGGHDLIKNQCGNIIRRVILTKLEESKKTNQPHGEPNPEGAPSFKAWPKYNDILHQQMWVDWIQRAYQSGMRVMVGLAVNNVTLATGIEGVGAFDDKSVGDVQTSELKTLVGKHPWMEIAYSAADVRRIVGADKMAVIMGAELDDIGSFLYNKKPPTEAQVRAEIRRLHANGIRYIFPVHLTDNHFGGTAITESEFARANRFQFGAWWNLGCAGANQGISFQGTAGADVFHAYTLGEAGGWQPVPKCGTGHVNTRGLQGLGKVAINEMMKLGMLIDMDHMSQKTADEVLAFATTKAGEYPLVSGHNGPRGRLYNTEYNRSASHLASLGRRQGVIGIGWAHGTAADWLALARGVSGSMPIALGSDINGFVEMPHAPPECAKKACVVYGKDFPQAQTGNRKWDYNLEGVAHIGLFPDFLRHVEGLPDGRAIVDRLFNGAEGFARAWERAEKLAKVVVDAK